MEKKPVKIVTIGGGSSYTPELMEGFIRRYDELPIKEIWLVDIEDGKEKLEIVGAMAQRMWDASPYDVKVHLTLDRREALKDADFVTTQFRVGQLDAREKDELIPLKYGVIGQETNGPGGMFKGLRTIPVIFDIIKEVHKRGVTILLIEQNANMALRTADYGYVLETGKIIMQDTGAALLANEDVKAAYLGKKRS